MEQLRNVCKQMYKQAREIVGEKAEFVEAYTIYDEGPAVQFHFLVNGGDVFIAFNDDLSLALSHPSSKAIYAIVGELHNFRSNRLLTTSFFEAIKEYKRNEEMGYDTTLDIQNGDGIGTEPNAVVHAWIDLFC